MGWGFSRASPKFPQSREKTVGEALRFAQRGGKHPKAKPLRGIGSGVLEIIARHDTDTYRAVTPSTLAKKSMFSTPSKRSPLAASEPRRRKLI